MQFNTSEITPLSETYDANGIESSYQAQWLESKVYEVDTAAPRTAESQDRFYCLAMFPYPSGQLHMGHVRNYTISDTIARVARLQGQQVLHPMGWDAFGLPAENAAIKNKVPPADWTQRNIQAMRQQLQQLGLAVDWSKELATCDPDYYKWEQLLFLKMYEQGLVYKKESVVNWDPVDQTVLANEQVIDGKGWRSGAPVERRKIPQWFLKITDYADQLLDGLDQLTGWPESVKAMQRNWIGRSKGAMVKFQLESNQVEGQQKTIPLPAGLDHLEVFTTRPDTLYGVTYLAIAPQHALALAAAQQNAELQDLINRMSNIKTAEADLATLPKEGCLTPFHARHPLTGQSVPIWVANYVLADYGSGAVMCVPAHDQRDWEFATQYAIQIQPVIATDDSWDYSQGALLATGTLINSAEHNGLSTEQAQEALTQLLESKSAGQAKIEYRLRDWGVSRQRYWGAPIPMIHCETCGDVPVPAADLPVKLPEDVTFSGAGGSPLAQHPTFQHVQCPKCQAPARRETDTFDTFMESSWYYARFTCPNEDQQMVSDAAKHWTPVDQYIGGIEHATMHLLYSRFIHKVLRDFNLVDSNEPFTRLLCQGMVLSESFHRTSDQGEKIYVNSKDVAFETDHQGRVIKVTEKATGLPLSLGTLEKMSKSKNNGVDPNDLIKQYGADTVRLFSMFAAPPEQTLEWSDAGVEGAFRFLKRFWKQAQQYTQSIQASVPLETTRLNPAQREMRLHTHTALAKVTDDYIRRQNFNTGIAALMKLSNQLSSFNDTSPQGQAVRHECLCIMTLLLSPIAPHICAEVWQALQGTDLLAQTWPALDEAALITSQINLVVQVNGKKRHELDIDASLTQADIEAQVLAQPQVQKFIGESKVVKIIYVPGRLVNIVVR